MKLSCYEKLLDVLLDCMDATTLVERLEQYGFVIVDHEQLRRVLRRSRQQTHEARRQRDRAVARLADVIAFDGASHDDPECPEDDTCSCANVRDINEILGSGPRTAKAGSRMSSARAEAWRLKEGQNLQDAHRWREHLAAIKASGTEPSLGAESQVNRLDCVYFKAGAPAGDCGGDGHFMCKVCAKKVAG